ncbi:MAG: hypothetical protein H6582_10110 [Crocinitomicaceae bacterium]|nr:hypothetical protein [Crocinitomicaceae bacterium]
MKQLFTILSFAFFGHQSIAQDSTFWQHAFDYEVGQKETIERDWGREVICYLGNIKWKSPSGKELEIRIVTSYQQITKANGFNDRCILSLVKADHTLIKSYDLVKRLNLPFEIRDNSLVYNIEGEEIVSPLPDKFGPRLCVKGHTCFGEIIL